ncbi:hypothetical protein HOD29_05605 [archaeon]|nr:hypothetical protein [archaeon]
MGKNIEEIKKELEKRGMSEVSKEEINSWAIVFALEDIASEMKKSLAVKGLEIKG